MDALTVACQLIIAAGLFNVWVLRRDRPSRWRPEGASDLEQEFRRYGLPDWVRVAVGVAKLSLAALLVVGIWVRPLAALAGAGLTLLMLAAVLAHVRVGDPPIRSLPAAALLVLSACVTWANAAG